MGILNSGYKYTSKNTEIMEKGFVLDGFLMFISLTSTLLLKKKNIFIFVTDTNKRGTQK